MRIYLEKSEKVTGVFVYWLINRIRLNLKLNSDPSRLIGVHTRLKELDNRLDGINIITAFSSLLSNIVSRESKDGYFIEVSSHILLSQDGISLYDYWKLINYGTFEVPGYPLVTDTFSDIVYRIDDYYKIFKLEVGGISCQ